MTIREMCELSGLTQTAFSAKYNIPLRTVQHWINGDSICPDYVIQLLERCVINENIKKTAEKKPKRTASCFFIDENSYKTFEKVFIGASDGATLIMLGGDSANGLKAEELHFGEDSTYQAYLVEGSDVVIGSHYRKVAEFADWLKIFDDDLLTLQVSAKNILVYRAKEMGCIIQLIND